ncbi:riboflavin biosynthesis protein PYRD, chloroplastic isoform X1 [Zea mays]|nr:riboflavin biosynthesis protein PYRD, chloroplastic isoform X1 [Zea mays]|eukprot:XP_023157702.1 riboflavin biosynthesis protein PYRD, chloroplastic isoform X1 [Zea mays]
MVAGRRRTRRANSISTASSKKAEGGARGRERPARRPAVGTKGRNRGSRQQPTKRAQGSAAREPAAAVEQRAWRVTELGLARTGSLLVETWRPPSDWAPLPSRSLASRHRSLPTRMASSLVSRPHLTQRPVRAATLASATRPRLVAGALGGRCQAQAAGDLDDAHYMRRCVELARKAAGHTSPNPMVGCVIVRDGRVVGEGFHPKAGQPHAEVFALRDAGNLAENATAYVSLEPCNHYGRTPPCTEALINAKVKEVVVGMTDPNPIVASKGIEKLQGAGISVRVGVEEALCRKLNEAYIHRMLTGKAFATLRATLSMNGIITNQIGKGADQSGGYYSQLMKEYDGVIISSDLAKMSALPLSREAGTNQPLCIIIAQGESSRLHIPSLSQEHASRAIVLADSPVTVEPAGVEVAVFRQIDLESILQLLAQRGLCSVLVDFREAGESFASLLNDFQEDKLVQKVVVEVLPFWLASDGLSNLAFGGSQSFPLKNLELRDVNGSVLLEGYV